MNFFQKIGLAVATTTVAFASTVVPAEARPPRAMCRDNSTGWRVCVEPKGRNGVEVTVNNSYLQSGFIAIKDCSTGYYRWRSNDGWTKQEIDEVLLAVCKM